MICEAIIFGLSAYLYIHSVYDCFFGGRRRLENSSSENENEFISHYPQTLIVKRRKSDESLEVLYIPIADLLPKIDTSSIKELTTEIECCSICLETNDVVHEVRRTHCGHSFCSNCILEWMKRSPRCPLCNSDLITEYCRISQLYRDGDRDHTSLSSSSR
jgi:hypothetical protein